MRDCNECRACCEGWLNGHAFGCAFGSGKPCVFLLGGCSVYEFRPEVCRSFYCAWSQELLPEWMRPDRCGALVSVERWSKGQYLRCIGMGRDISEDSKSEVKRFCLEHSAPVVFEANGRVEIHGSDEFSREFISKLEKTHCSSLSGISREPAQTERLSLPLCHG